MAKQSVEYLLTSINEADFLKVRNIDTIIHKIYIDNEQKDVDRYEHYNFDINNHVKYDEKLKQMMTLYSREELKMIFNDPTVYYNAGRFYLNGKTGTMSSILLNSHFILYEYLLSENVEINPYQDILIILDRILTLKPQEQFNDEERRNITKELKSLCNILKLINKKYGVQIKIINYEGYHISIDIKNNFIWTNICEYIKEQSEIFKKQNLDHPMIKKILSDRGGKLYENDQDLYNSYGVWEYNPRFFESNSPNICELSYKQSILELLNKFIRDNKIYDDYRQKYIKYKQKYLSIKNK
jgi:hypothetical protein